MDWADVPEKMDAWAVAVAAPAWDLRKAAADIFTVAPLGFYLHGETGKIGLYCTSEQPTDFARCKCAAARSLGDSQIIPLTAADFGEPWIKVAESPVLQRAGQYLNFFPGQYPGGIPNAPSPLAAMLTSGLVGAGLGWGGGKLLGKLLPEGYGDNLGRTGMVLGGLAGAVPGAIWGGVNLANKKSLLDAWPNTPPGHNEGPIDAHWMDGGNADVEGVHANEGALQRYIRELQLPAGAVQRIKGAELSIDYIDSVRSFVKRAFGDTMGDWAPQRHSTPADVNINALGQTLWQLAAPPDLATTTMGAMYAAQQMPDSASRPGWATGRQLGQLSENMGGDFSRGPLVGMAINAAQDYAAGLLGGAALNATVGTPYRASTYGVGNMALGIIGAIVPRLFGH